jgi:hypothetical protein
MTESKLPKRMEKTCVPAATILGKIKMSSEMPFSGYFGISHPGVDFIKQFNLRPTFDISALRTSFLHSLTLIGIMHLPLRSTYCILSQIWKRSALYAVHPTFMKFTQGITQCYSSGYNIITISTTITGKTFTVINVLFFANLYFLGYPSSRVGARVPS